jgi:hypothetical protein
MMTHECFDTHGVYPWFATRFVSAGAMLGMNEELGDSHRR